MGILIDSSVLIDFERGRIDLSARVEGREDEAFFLSVISASELLHGVYRATDSRIRARRTAFVEAALERFPLLPVDLKTARTHAQVWADLMARGLSIGLHDSWLAATCIAYGLTIATGNVREFERVSGLRVERWTEAD
ncbi:MAG: type II toxin-antitoxin system VapC family toxin [bacterium]|nr:type II toxin-antitoxin system VapC family toxin [bacterium]